MTLRRTGGNLSRARSFGKAERVGHLTEVHRFAPPKQSIGHDLAKVRQILLTTNEL
jgi:hypothetical protein